MADSGIYWVDVIFNICVKFLYDAAAILGITYEEINVWLFCVIWPIVTIYMSYEIIKLRLRIARLSKQTNFGNL